MGPSGDPAPRPRIAELALIAAALTAGVSCAHIEGDPCAFECGAIAVLGTHHTVVALLEVQT